MFLLQWPLSSRVLGKGVGLIYLKFLGVVCTEDAGGRWVAEARGRVGGVGEGFLAFLHSGIDSLEVSVKRDGRILRIWRAGDSNS
jgi:hypothetical protein